MVTNVTNYKGGFIYRGCCFCVLYLECTNNYLPCKHTMLSSPQGHFWGPGSHKLFLWSKEHGRTWSQGSGF